MKHWKAALAVVVVLAVLGGGIGYLLSRPDDSPAPATRQSLAALAVEVLDLEPTSFEVNPPGFEGERLAVAVMFVPSDGGDSDRVLLAVVEGENLRKCSDEKECDKVTHDGHDVRLSWQDGHPEEDPGYVQVELVEDGEVRSVAYTGDFVDGDPRKDDLSRDVDQLLELVTDDRFASTTTQELVDVRLAKWPEDDALGDPVPLTSRILASQMQDFYAQPRSAYAVDASAYGPDAVGAEYAYRNGNRISVVVTPADAKQAPTCEPGWDCTTLRDVTHGWKPGVAITIETVNGVTVLATLHSDKVTERIVGNYNLGNDVTFFWTALSGQDWEGWSLTATKMDRTSAEKLRFWEE